jgi:hypothetical protein
MDILKIVFGLVGISSLLFSIFVYFNSKSKKIAEAAKIAVYKEKLRNTHYASTAILHTIDSIVQIPKKGEVTIDQLQDIARVARGQIYLLVKQIEIHQKDINNWRFGELIKSDLAFEKSVNDKNNTDDLVKK